MSGQGDLWDLAGGLIGLGIGICIMIVLIVLEHGGAL